MATGDRIPLTTKNTTSFSHNSTLSYNTGSSVLHTDGHWYTANGNIPAGTSFSVGTGSTQWTRRSAAETETYTSNRVMMSNSAGKLAVSNITTTELEVIDGGTSSANVTPIDADRVVLNDAGTMRQTAFSYVWTYIKSKMTGAISTVIDSGLTTNRALLSDNSGKIAVSSVTNLELATLDGVNTGKTLDYQMKEKSHRLRTFSVNNLAPHEIITDITFITTSETVLPTHIPFYCNSEAEARQNLPYFLSKLWQCIGGLDNDRSHDVAGTLYTSLLSNGNFVTTPRTVGATDIDPSKSYNDVFKLILGANNSTMWWVPVSPWSSETTTYYGTEGLSVINAAGTTWTTIPTDGVDIKIYSTANLTKASSGVNNSNTYINNQICAAYFMPISLRLKS